MKFFRNLDEMEWAMLLAFVIPIAVLVLIYCFAKDDPYIQLSVNEWECTDTRVDTFNQIVVSGNTTSVMPMTSTRCVQWSRK